MLKSLASRGENDILYCLFISIGVPMTVSEYNKKLTSGFFAFWLTQWRTTFLVLILIVLIGTFAAIRIPKESSPDVSFGMVVITTVYP
jgi:hypothetical protein